MPETPEHRELLARLGPNDQDAFAELFSIHRKRLKRMLAHRIDARLLVRTDLSDILQEVYIEALKRVEHFLTRPELSFYVWLRQITLQRLIDVHRMHLLADKRSLKSQVSLSQQMLSSSASEAWALQLVASHVSPSQAAIHDEMVARVEATLCAMDPMDREVLVLRHFDELRNNEVAEVLGLSPAAASNRYVRALKRLRNALISDSNFSR